MVIASAARPRSSRRCRRITRPALAAIDRLDAWGTTPLYDATAVALDAIQSAKGRRALVAVVGRQRSLQRDDGRGPGRSGHGAATCWSIRWRSARDGPRCSPSWRRPAAADRSSQTDPRELSATLTAIAQRAAIAIPARLHAGARRCTAQPSWHSIEVVVNRPGVRVRARDGYVLEVERPPRRARSRSVLQQAPLRDPRNPARPAMRSAITARIAALCCSARIRTR